MSQRALLGGREEIISEWFTAIFQENGIILDSAVVDTQTKIIGQDRGFTGVIVRARLQYAGTTEMALAL